MDYIGVLEQALDELADKNLLPLQPGDVLDTYANVDNLLAQFGFEPATWVVVGVARFIDCCRDYLEE